MSRDDIEEDEAHMMLTDVTDEVFTEIEGIHGIKLDDHTKMLMHMYYGMLTIKLQGDD